jgi:hypothetical protein
MWNYDLYFFKKKIYFRKKKNTYLEKKIFFKRLLSLVKLSFINTRDKRCSSKSKKGDELLKCNRRGKKGVFKTSRIVRKFI